MNKKEQDLYMELLYSLTPEVFNWKPRRTCNSDWSSLKTKIGSTIYSCALTFCDDLVVVDVIQNPDGMSSSRLGKFKFNINDLNGFKQTQEKLKNLFRKQLQRNVDNSRKQVKNFEKFKRNLVKMEQQLLQLGETETLQTQENNP